MSTPGGEWDEGEQESGGRGELEEERGVGGIAKEPARAEVQGLQPRGQQPNHWRWVAGVGNRADHAVRKEWGVGGGRYPRSSCGKR